MSLSGVSAEPQPVRAVGGLERSLRSAAVFTAVLALQRAIGFVLLPVYTRALSPGEYGALGLLLSVATLAGILFAAGLEVAIFRNYFALESEPERQRRYVDSMWRFLTVWPLTAALVGSAIAWPFVGSGGTVTGFDVMLTLVGAALGVAASTYPLILLRARQELRRYLAAAATPTIATPLLTVLFIVVLDLGLRGFLLAILIANALSLVASALVVPWRRAGAFDRAMVVAALAFSLPLLPHTLSHWALQFADRSVLAGLVGATSLGVYVLASNLAAPLLMVLISLNQGFMPSYARAGTDPANAASLRGMVVVQIVAVAGLTLAAALLGGPLADILAPASYHGAGSLVPWIALGYGFLGLYFVPMNGATLAAGRSGLVWVATVLAAACDIGLIYLFVPDHGVKAAAVASAVAYGLLLIGTSIWAHARPNPVTYPWRRIVPALAATIVIYALASATSPAGEVAALVAHAAWLLAFPLAIVGLGVIPLRTLVRR